MLKRICNYRVLPVLLAALTLVGASNACAAEMTNLIDFGQLATDIKPLISTAVTAAAGIGAVVLAAFICWKFFKRFISG